MNLTTDDLQAPSALSGVVSLLATDSVLLTRDGDSIVRITVANLWTDVPLTGNPTAPTQAPGDASTKLATTGFVENRAALLQPLSERTTVGGNFYKLTNPSAITFPKINADNSVSTESAATYRTSLGLGTAALEAIGTVGSTVPKLDGANTWGATQTVGIAGGAAYTIEVQSEAGAVFRGTRYSTDASGPTNVSRKARGTIASPTTIAQNDIVNLYQGQAYTGAGFTTCGSLRQTITAAAPSASDLEGKWEILACPAGSATATVVAKFEHATGLSMFGSNPVIDQSRHFRLRNYTVGTLPSASPAGQVARASDARRITGHNIVTGAPTLEGAGAGTGSQVNSDGTNWCLPGTTTVAVA